MSDYSNSDQAFSSECLAKSCEICCSINLLYAGKKILKILSAVSAMVPAI